MNLALFYDSETTGLPLDYAPEADPRQPHVVQLGACLVDLDTRTTLSALDVICLPDGWEIPAQAAAVHGITTEMALAVGVPEKLAVTMLLSMAKRAAVRVGHNEQFDARILRTAALRFHGDSVADAWSAGAAKCTGAMSTPILKLPPTERMRASGRAGFKMPRLGEAYRHFTGRELQNAHSAMADVQGCMEVFFAIEKPQA
jgi:DNA polymerase-3 subunit epsilon